MIRVQAHSSGPAAEAWSLFARPARWPEWSPYIRGARGLGSPEVAAGCSGTVLLLGLPLLPAQITAVDSGRSWRWRVGPIDMNHEVRVEGDGCVISASLSAPRALELGLRVSYAPMMALSMRNLARKAARAPRPAPAAAPR